jgi:hypothetical protein
LVPVYAGLAFVGLICVLIAVGMVQECQRKKALQAWAQARQLSFLADKDYSCESRFPYFSCLKQGNSHSRYGFNHMWGSYRGREICAFDYHCTTGTGKSKKEKCFSAVVVESDLPLKPLLIRGETFLDKVGEFFGLDDIDFESAEFSRQFHVTSPDRRWAFDVLHQQAMEFLLDAPRFDLQVHSGRVIAHREHLFSVGEFEAALDVVIGLLDQLPNSVVCELKGKK